MGIYSTAGSSVETQDVDNLLAGSKPVVTKPVTIAAGADLTRGAVLGLVTANGKHALSASAAGDGSEVPDAILAYDAPAAAADVETIAYVEGEFNEADLSFGTGHDADSVRQTLRQRGVHLRTVG